jgi:hypothetical protein
MKGQNGIFRCIFEGWGRIELCSKCKSPKIPSINLLEQNRTWICKPRYSYAGRGIYVISVNSDLNTIFKFKIGSGNRLQHEPRLPGYLMQE